MLKINRKGIIKSSKIYSINEDLKKESTWESECGSKSGIYFYVAHKPINYPFAKNKIFYIGRAKNLAHRLAWHFRRDMNERSMLFKDKNKDKKTSMWFYQNYYLRKIPFDIVWIYCENAKYIERLLEDIERLFIGLFAAEYGTIPICNGSVQRKKLKETYEKYSNSKVIEEIKKILKKFETK